MARMGGGTGGAGTMAGVTTGLTTVRVGGVTGVGVGTAASGGCTVGELEWDCATTAVRGISTG